MLMGRQSPATQMVTFSRTGLVIFLEKSWSVGWRSSNLGPFCRVLCLKVVTSRRAASVIAKFSLTNATYNFSFVDCSVILALKQKLSAQQSLSSLHLQLPQWLSNFFCHSPLGTRGAIGRPSPLLTLPEGTQVQVWPDVISQSSPHLFSASLPVITS